MLMGTVWEDENVLGTVVRCLPSCVKVLNTPKLPSEKWLIGYIHVISAGRADAKKLQYFTHLVGRADSLEKTLMLGKIEGGRRERQR